MAVQTIEQQTKPVVSEEQATPVVHEQQAILVVPGEQATPVVYEERRAGWEKIKGFFNFIRKMAPASGFDVYLMNLHRSGHSGTPTRDEARRDYNSAIRARDRHMF